MAALALVEIWFSDLLHWAFERDSFVPLDVVFAAVLFLAYATLGATLAAAVAALTHGLRFSLPSCELGTAIVLVLFAATMRGPLGGALLAAMEVEVAVLLAVALAALVSGSFARGARFMTSPWTMSFLLFGPAWTANQVPASAGRVARGAAFAAAAALIVAIAWLVFRRPFGRGPASLATTSVALVTFAAVLFAEPAVPLQLPFAGPAPPAASPSILLVTLDTVRADHLSLYGYPGETTPFLKRLAASATVYTSAIAPSNLTVTTHASLFSGLYGNQHHTRFPDVRPLGPPITTLAEVLAKRGYDASSVASNYFVLGSGFGLDRGFAYVDARPRRSTLGLIDARSLRGIFRSLLCRIFPDRWPLTDTSARPADEITERAIERMDRARRVGRPYFLFVNYFDPHERVLVPPAFEGRFDASRGGPVNDLFARLIAAMRNEGRVSVPESERDRIARRYDASLAYVDESLDRLIRHARALDPEDRTFIVVTSDHGEALGDHDTISHGSSVYDEQVRVPLVVREPGQRQARVMDGRVSLVDLFPFLAGQIGELPADRDVVSESFPFMPKARMGAGRAIYRGRYKLIRPSPRASLAELYDIGDDPGETHDLSGRPEYADLASEMSARLDRWLAEHPALALPETPDDGEARARLRALGYLH